MSRPPGALLRAATFATVGRRSRSEAGADHGSTPVHLDGRSGHGGGRGHHRADRRCGSRPAGRRSDPAAAGPGRQPVPGRADPGQQPADPGYACRLPAADRHAGQPAGPGPERPAAGQRVRQPTRGELPQRGPARPAEHPARRAGRPAEPERPLRHRQPGQPAGHLVRHQRPGHRLRAAGGRRPARDGGGAGEVRGDHAPVGPLAGHGRRAHAEPPVGDLQGAGPHQPPVAEPAAAGPDQRLAGRGHRPERRGRVQRTQRDLRVGGHQPLAGHRGPAGRQGAAAGPRPAQPRRHAVSAGRQRRGRDGALASPGPDRRPGRLEVPDVLPRAGDQGRRPAVRRGGRADHRPGRGVPRDVRHPGLLGR